MTDFVKKKYLNKLESLKDKVNLVKVITGIRGSGKSTLLNAEKESLLAKGINQKDIISVNLDLDSNKNIKTSSDLIELIKKQDYDSETTKYLFIDEIQYVKNFEEVLVQYFSSKKYSIFISSSNKCLFSKKFLELFSGQYEVIELKPLSLKEFNEVANINKLEPNSLLAGYILESGFIETLNVSDLVSKIEITRKLLNNILEKDVLPFVKVNSLTIAKEITTFIINNFDSIIDKEEYDEFLKSYNGLIKLEDINDYLLSLENAYVIKSVKVQDINSNEVINAKYFLSDLGLFTCSMTKKAIDYDCVVENIIFNTLNDVEILSCYDNGVNLGLMIKSNSSLEIIKVITNVGRNNAKSICDSDCYKHLITLDSSIKKVVVTYGKVNRTTNDDLIYEDALNLLLNK